MSSSAAAKSVLQQSRLQTQRSSRSFRSQGSRPMSPFRSLPTDQFSRAKSATQTSANDDEEREEQPREESQAAQNMGMLSREQDIQNAMTRMQTIGGSKLSQLNKARAMMRTFNSLQANTEEEASKTNKEIRGIVKFAIPFIANFIATALEFATFGLAFILTFLIRFITLLWYNVQMIYGRWIMKGKHKIIPPLSWEPFRFGKMIDPNANIPQALVLISNFLCISVPIIIIALIAWVADQGLSSFASLLF